MVSIGVNPYKLFYALLIAAALAVLGVAPSGEMQLFALALVAWILAHVTFVWFKKIVFRKVIAFDMGGVLVGGDYYSERLRPTKEMVDLVIKLRRKYVTALLSDNNDLFAPGARKIMPMGSMFDYELWSSLVGGRKTDARSFQNFLRKIGAKASDVIFIDDSAGNIDVAKRVGIRGIVFKNPGQLKEALAAHGIRF